MASGYQLPNDANVWFLKFDGTKHAIEVEVLNFIWRCVNTSWQRNASIIKGGVDKEKTAPGTGNGPNTHPHPHPLPLPLKDTSFHSLSVSGID